jgi:hypothetical protein
MPILFVRHASRVLAVALLLASVACEPTRDAPPLTIEGFAAALSGGRTDPVCRNRGPRGEYLGPIPGAEHCEWPTVTRGAEYSTVTATRDSLNGWTSITVNRLFVDTARVTVFLDSLDSEFTAAGHAAHLCKGGGRQWQTKGLVVQSTPPFAAPTGGHSLMLFAVESPAAIPRLLCPDAPPPPIARFGRSS